MNRERLVAAGDTRYLPIISAYGHMRGIAEEVDRLCGSKPGVKHATVVMALLLDVLSGRTPLFRLPQAFAKLDTELLLGRPIGEVHEEPVHGRGRPRADGTRKVVRMRYRLKLSIQPREQAIERACKEAGCFVLLSNEPAECELCLGRTMLIRRWKKR